MPTMKACRAAACLLLLALPSCARRGAPAPVLAPAEAAPAGEVFQTGVASWYGGEFQGRTTANGEVYDMYKLTAAHPRLPFHSIVEVENLVNSRRVRVRINDRGPFLKDRIIDLSFEAARRLGMADQGTAAVGLRLVRRKGAGEGKEDSAPAAAGRCVVQAGAFSLRQNAEDLLLVLADIFPVLAFRVAEEEGLFKVISPELEAKTCREVLRLLAAYRLQGFIRESTASPSE